VKSLFLTSLVVVVVGIGGASVWQPEAAAWLAVGALAGGAIGFLAIWGTGRKKDEPVVVEETKEEAIQITAEPVSPRVLLAAMMSSLREGVLVVGEDTRVIGSNLSARYIFSHVAPPLEGKRLTELTRNLSVHQAFQSALEQGERTEVKVETRGDDKRMFDLRVAPLHFESNAATNEPRSAIGIFYDITQIEKLEKVRQEFLSNVSHELRTPLTAILAFVETLEDGAINDAENNVRFLSVIRKNAERMHRLINDILELSAIESGKITVRPKEIKLALLVDEIADNLVAKADAVDVEIINEVPDDTTVYADNGRLEQMLTNLVDNAIKFNREGGTVTVTYESKPERDCIHVADTGEGIMPEHIERIFERFYRVDRARTTREVGGTGLGLAIVKHLARLHGGEATVISTLGKGSTFTIELPKNK
jgi:two-component system, OmpR family, phosphate regulon sensor histidine kinase PhoR